MIKDSEYLKTLIFHHNIHFLINLKYEYIEYYLEINLDIPYENQIYQFLDLYLTHVNKKYLLYYQIVYLLLLIIFLILFLYIHLFLMILIFYYFDKNFHYYHLFPEFVLFLQIDILNIFLSKLLYYLNQ